ncbi:MAG: aminotransferase class V-fold PLP-dependent enzyme [Pseudomonadota bacterium]
MTPDKEIYAELGVASIINAKGTATRLGGIPLRPEVSAAMAAASEASIEIVQLQARASEIIAAATGAEAGLVTSGAAAGLLLGAAACIVGLDPTAMNRLPDTRGLKNQIIMIKSQRNGYDHAVRTTGARIIEVGLADHIAGAGIRSADAWEIEAAISDRTAAILWVARPDAEIDLATIVDVAKRYGVPVMVDAAARATPASNLKDFIEAGADLVAFSGGKALGGPQASGILCGRRDLIMSAALQMLDQDIAFSEFAPPAHFIDKDRLRGLPSHGIGRPCKAGKEEIVGLLTALRLFNEESDETRFERWQGLVEPLADAIRRAQLVATRPIPHIVIETVTDAALVAQRLRQHTPSIFVETSEARYGRLIISPLGLRPSDLPAVIDAFAKLDV